MSKYEVKFDNGATIELRRTTGKQGQGYLAARPASETMVTRFGFNVNLSVVGGSLPKSGQLLQDGKEIATVKLDSGTTGSGNPKVEGQSSESFDYDGDQQHLSVRVSQPHDTTANVLIRSARPRGARTHASL